MRDWEASELSCGSISKYVWGEIGKCAISAAAAISKAVVDARPSTIIYPDATNQDYDFSNDPSLSGMEDTENGPTYSKEMYESSYQRLEDHVKQLYDALCRYGGKVKNKDTKEDVHGYAGGTRGWRPQYYTSLKKNLRSFQSLMVKTRHNASKHGFTIEKSRYETIDVSY